MMEKYKKIINLPHHTSPNRPRMSLLNRAQQFQPFSALSGYDEKIKETSRLTQPKKKLTNEEKEIINLKLNYIMQNNIFENVNVLYFEPDKVKNGGEHLTYIGVIKRIDTFLKLIYFKDKKVIKIDDIISINAPFLDEIFN